MVGLLCWNLWNRRNKWIWERVNTSGFGVKAMSLNMMTDWNRAREEEEKYRTQQGNTPSWCKPPEGWIKINVDAACTQGEIMWVLGA